MLLHSCAFVAVCIPLLIAMPVAGDFRTGMDAYHRGDYAAALRELRPLAEQGEVEAQLYLGVMYESGQGVPKDDDEAVKWYREALKLYKKAAALPDGRVRPTYVLLSLGRRYDSGEQRLAATQYNLGLIYDLGHGVSENDMEAVKWYRKAAEQGLASAQYKLGVMYADGSGVPEDDAEAVRWFRKAAEQGDASAQNSLGVMYADGHGVPQNDVQAYAWLNIAAAQGDYMAEQNKKLIAESMTPEQLARAQELARQYWETYALPFRN